MLDGQRTFGAFDAGKPREENHIEGAMDYLDRQDQFSGEAEYPVESACSLLQGLRAGDRSEAQLDSHRRFRWHLALVRAAAGHAPPDYFEPSRATAD
jgi:hypothetical protein